MDPVLSKGQPNVYFTRQTDSKIYSVPLEIYRLIFTDNYEKMGSDKKNPGKCYLVDIENINDPKKWLNGMDRVKIYSEDNFNKFRKGEKNVECYLLSSSNLPLNSTMKGTITITDKDFLKNILLIDFHVNSRPIY